MQSVCSAAVCKMQAKRCYGDPLRNKKLYVSRRKVGCSAIS